MRNGILVRRITSDDEHALPWRTEAYRLWFEFLKLARTDPNLKWSTEHYAAWDNVASMGFDEWWATHWQKLFAVERRAQEITDSEEWSCVSRNPNRMVISLPLDCDIRGTLEDLRKLLDAKGAGKRRRQKQGTTGAAYSISAENLKYPSLRQLLRIYGYWLDTGGSLDDTASRYYKWTRATNAKRDEWEKKRKNRGKEPFWRKVTETGWESYVKGDEHDRRRAMRRYIGKARKIADNVSKGVFPGSF
jgi:hypothetical protein